MSIDANAQNISQLVNTDIEACTNLINLLEKEQQALKERDIDGLSQIVESKVPLLARLEESAHIRTTWAQSNTQQDASENWNKLLDELAETSIKDDWNTLKSLLTQCQSMNEVNGKMLSRNQKVFGRLLDIVRGQNASKSLYNAAGISSGAKRSQIVGKA